MPHTTINIIQGRPPVPFAANNATISEVAQSMTDIGFTTAQLDLAKRAIFSGHGGEVHFRFDGTAPTGTVGLMLDDTGQKPIGVVVGTENIRNLQFIKENLGGDVEIFVQLER